MNLLWCSAAQLGHKTKARWSGDPLFDPHVLTLIAHYASEPRLVVDEDLPDVNPHWVIDSFAPHHLYHVDSDGIVHVWDRNRRQEVKRDVLQLATDDKLRFRGLYIHPQHPHWMAVFSLRGLAIYHHQERVAFMPNIENVVLHPHSKLLLVKKNGLIRGIDWQGQVQFSFRHRRKTYCWMMAHPVENSLFLYDVYDNQMILFDLDTRQLTRQFAGPVNPEQHTEAVYVYRQEYFVFAFGQHLDLVTLFGEPVMTIPHHHFDQNATYESFDSQPSWIMRSTIADTRQHISQWVLSHRLFKLTHSPAQIICSRRPGPDSIRPSLPQEPQQ